MAKNVAKVVGATASERGLSISARLLVTLSSLMTLMLQLTTQSAHKIPHDGTIMMMMMMMMMIVDL